MFHYLNQSNCFELDDVDDSKEYLDTRRAMDIVGISPDEQVNCSLLLSMFPLVNYCFTKQVLYVFSLFLFFKDAIFRVVAAILHLGNVEFSEGEETDSSVLKDEKSQFHLKTAAELFM